MHNRIKMQLEVIIKSKGSWIIYCNFLSSCSQISTQEDSFGDVQKGVSLGEGQQGRFFTFIELDVVLPHEKGGKR